MNHSGFSDVNRFVSKSQHGLNRDALQNAKLAVRERNAAAGSLCTLEVFLD